MPSTTRVSALPTCNLCGQPAYADARIPGSNWAYVCFACFSEHHCVLGTGCGQRLVLAPDNKPELSFETWMRRVDMRLVATCGMSSEDLPDWDYSSAHADGITPADAATAALEDAGFN